jgi:hypothetical protein
MCDNCVRKFKKMSQTKEGVHCMSILAINNGRNNAFSCVQNETEKQKENLFQVFSAEILAKIFSHTNLPTLGVLRQVSQGVGNVANIPSVEKNVIFRTVAFGNRQWAALDGEGLIFDEKPEEEFNDLPNDFGKTFKELFPGEKMKNFLLVRILKTHTIKNLQEVLLKYGNLEATFREDKPKPITNSYWIVAPLHSGDFCTRKRWKIRANPALETPTAIEGLAAMVAQRSEALKFQKFLFHRISEQEPNFPLAVGGFSQAGLRIDRSAFNTTGVMGIRRFY